MLDALGLRVLAAGLHLLVDGDVPLGVGTVPAVQDGLAFRFDGDHLLPPPIGGRLFNSCPSYQRRTVLLP